MRPIPDALAAHLAGGATTTCRAWTLTRRDGVRLGFTDHDRDLVLDGLAHQARTGLEAAEVTAELGFAVGGGDVAGALNAAGITEADLAAGLYDDATVATWLVNWAEPAQKLLLDWGTLGEVRRADGAFVAEVRGVLHRLDEERGRLYRATCAADLGDARCGVALGPVLATVVATDGALELSTGGLETYAEGWFTGGALTWTGGANGGLTAEVKAHRRAAGLAALELWQRSARPIAPGDPFALRPGCDKRFATCRTKFGNALNFRGFPHLPGNDAVIRVVRQGEPEADGGSLFR